MMEGVILDFIPFYRHRIENLSGPGFLPLVEWGLFSLPHIPTFKVVQDHV